MTNESKTTEKIRLGFRGKQEACLFRLWKEYWENGEIVFAKTIFVLGENKHSDPMRKKLHKILLRLTYRIWRPVVSRLHCYAHQKGIIGSYQLLEIEALFDRTQTRCKIYKW